MRNKTITSSPTFCAALLGAFVVATITMTGGSARAAVGGPTCYVPADYLTIQAAVNDPGCATIVVAAGVHPENVFIPRAVTILGPNYNRAGAGTRNPEAIVYSMFATASDVIVRGFSFANPAPSWEMMVSSGSSILSGVVVGNNIFSGYGSVGLPTNNAGNMLIVANLFHNPVPGSEAIQIKANLPAPQGGCNGTQITNNVFDAASDNGGADANLSCTGSASKNVVVSDNKDSGLTNGTSFTAFSGVIDGIVVGDNNVTGTPTSGSLVFFFGGMSGTAQIVDNVLTGSSSSSGISVQGFLPAPNTGAFFVQHNHLENNNRSINIGSTGLGIGASFQAHRNDLSGDTTAGMENDSTTVTADAICNWWGSSTGPMAASNPSGTGDKAIGPINFKPWLKSANLDGPCAEGCHEGDGNGDFHSRDGRQGNFQMDNDKCEESGQGGNGESDQGDSVDSTDRGDGRDFHSTNIESTQFDAVTGTMTVTGVGTTDGTPVAFTIIAVGSSLTSFGSVTMIFSDGYSITGDLINGSIELN